MKVRQLRNVLKSAAAMRASAGDEAGALALLKFADEVAPLDGKSVGALAKLLVHAQSQQSKGLAGQPK